jgi:hypothetical protein
MRGKLRTGYTSPVVQRGKKLVPGIGPIRLSTFLWLPKKASFGPPEFRWWCWVWLERVRVHSFFVYDLKNPFIDEYHIPSGFDVQHTPR